ncbi:cell wall metabolism sensor histidine kinase WalK [Neobacillus niacini]|uniref:sensor histidine kinase n=1 Tax=Neobacillus niacini TaxID=86668 RepID=UPI0021CAE3DA|nr:ATP-binding protein [Neobacillus niacini]MCM3766731.1 ATP-binding protein [Neobacillus niacini]
MAKKSASPFVRLVIVVLICILSAAASTALLGYLVKLIYYNVRFPSELNYFITQTYANYGFWNLFFSGMAILTLLYFAFWMAKQIAYFKLISQSIEKLAEGQFDLDLPVKKRGSLTEVAQNLNQVKGQLESLIEEEKRAIRTKNELVTNVSHDLRTPLTSIIGYLRLIEEDQYQDEVELRYYVDIAHEKAKRLNLMVNDLFEFTKINNREAVLQTVCFSLTELLRQLSAQFIPELKAASMEMELHAPEQEIMIEADPDKLMRVFENLISNGIKYGRDGKKIDLFVEGKEAQAIVKVANYGEPIPAQALPLIFERMYRIEQSRSEATGGTGLGLAIAKGIVEMHNGDITVTSNERETVFQVRLPRH